MEYLLACYLAAVLVLSPTSKYTDEEHHMIADVIYLEARGESVTGRLAVGETVYNRVNLSYFPNTVKGVVYQKWAYATTSTGFPIDRSSSAYASAVNLAKLAEFTDNAKGATHFYSGDVEPWWWKHLVDKHVIGNHKFGKEVR